MESRLKALQTDVLHALAGMDPRWTLTGGGALAGFHLGHRETRDLDLFFHGESLLGDIPTVVEGRLRSHGIEVTTLGTAPSFRRLEARRGDETVLIDLVAEPVASVDPPTEQEPGVWVDTEHEILINKLCALYSRIAIRDLLDVMTLVRAGGDLERALAEAPRKDAGFSPPSLAWVLKDLPVARLAESASYDSAALVAFRDELIGILLD